MDTQPDYPSNRGDASTPGAQPMLGYPINPGFQPNNNDVEHLRLLSIFHYIVGGFGFLCSCFSLIYVAIGAMFLSDAMNKPMAERMPAPIPMIVDEEPPVANEPAAANEPVSQPADEPKRPQPEDELAEAFDNAFNDQDPNAPSPRAVGYLFIAIGAVLAMIGWTYSALILLSGYRISQRRWRTFSLVISGLNCLSVPIGTVLGAFTIIVLLRPSVQALYQAEAQQRY